jgi:hypothetical protein
MPGRKLRPCEYGGGKECERHGGDGAEKHFPGYVHPISRGSLSMSEPKVEPVKPVSAKPLPPTVEPKDKTPSVDELARQVVEELTEIKDEVAPDSKEKELPQSGKAQDNLMFALDLAEDVEDAIGINEGSEHEEKEPTRNDVKKPKEKDTVRSDGVNPSILAKRQTALEASLLSELKLYTDSKVAAKGSDGGMYGAGEFVRVTMNGPYKGQTGEIVAEADTFLYVKMGDGKEIQLPTVANQRGVFPISGGGEEWGSALAKKASIEVPDAAVEDLKSKVEDHKAKEDALKAEVEREAERAAELIDMFYSEASKEAGRVFEVKKGQAVITPNGPGKVSEVSKDGRYAKVKLEKSGQELPYAVARLCGKEKDAVTPPGKEKMVKELKKDTEVDNPWAVAWWQYDKEEKKEPKKESVLRNKRGESSEEPKAVSKRKCPACGESHIPAREGSPYCSDHCRDEDKENNYWREQKAGSLWFITAADEDEEEDEDKKKETKEDKEKEEDKEVKAIEEESREESENSDSEKEEFEDGFESGFESGEEEMEDDIFEDEIEPLDEPECCEIQITSEPEPCIVEDRLPELRQQLSDNMIDDSAKSLEDRVREFKEEDIDIKEQYRNLRLDMDDLGESLFGTDKSYDSAMENTYPEDIAYTNSPWMAFVR